MASQYGVLGTVVEVSEALALFQASKCSMAEFQAWSAARDAMLQAKARAEAPPQPLRLKVSEKGGVSLYGIQRQFPVTFYRGQWERILAHKDEILAFIQANAGKLSTKAPAKAEAPAAIG
jgi:hypothetical protein